MSPSDQAGPRVSAADPEVRPAEMYLHVELEVPARLRSQFDVATITAQAQLPGQVPLGRKTVASTDLTIANQGTHVFGHQLRSSADRG